jgi:hypothetical protein
VSVIVLLNVASILLALVVGSTSIEMEISPVSIIILLNVASILLALVVGSTSIEMEISPVGIIILLNVASILLALVVASQNLTASVLLALVMGLTSDKRGNQVVCSDWSTSLVLVSICSHDVGVVRLTAMRASTAFLDALLFSGTT